MSAFNFLISASTFSRFCFSSFKLWSWSLNWLKKCATLNLAFLFSSSSSEKAGLSYWTRVNALYPEHDEGACLTLTSVSSYFVQRKWSLCVAQSSRQRQHHCEWHVRHVIWKQPWFFSTVVPHLGQSFVFSAIHCSVIISAAALVWGNAAPSRLPLKYMFQSLSTLHEIVGWASSIQCKQNFKPHAQVPTRILPSRRKLFTARSQPGAGHHFKSAWLSTNVLAENRAYLAYASLLTSCLVSRGQ